MTAAGNPSLRRRPDTLRLGLCCQFAREPIRFRKTTATALLRLPRAAQLAFCRANAEALLTALARLSADLAGER